MKTNTTPHTWALRFLAIAIMTWPLLASAQSLLTPGWAGGNNTDSNVPPDPHGAAGPSGVIQTYNNSITYYGKAGNRIWGPTNVSTFFPSVAGGCSYSDAKVIYDFASQRFIIIEQYYTANPNRSFLNFACSRSSNPRTGTANDWNIYQKDVTKVVNNVPYAIDYPGFGVDSQAVYVSYNLFQLLWDPTNGCTLGGNAGTRTIILNKAGMVAGTTVGTSQFDTSDGPEQHLHPATPIGVSNPGNIAYLVGRNDNTHLKLLAISDPLGAGTVSSTLITTPDDGGGSGGLAPQLGTTNKIETVGTRVQAAVYQGGLIWATLTAGPAGGPAKVYYYRINPNGFPSGTPTLTESGTLGANTAWNYMPAIGANSAGDLAVVYTKSSSNEYPTMMYVYRSAADSGFGSPQVAKISGGPSITSGSRPRWGDYAAVSADPIDGSLWITHEYALDGGQNNWGTYFAQIGTPAYDLYVWNNSPCPFEFGNISCPYYTVTKAVNAATRGTIYIASGHYNEALTINKAVTLTTYNGTPAVIGAP